MTKPTDTQGLDQAIGMLRQWLNEDRIKDAKHFVTNEQLHHWLDDAIKQAYIPKSKVREAIPEKWTAEKIMSTAKAELSIASGFNQAIDQTLEALGLGEEK